MDASAYLTRHGWTGGGLGYQQSGIKKPILASQKHGFKKGLGGKPLGGHSDQWWLGAFDAGLKNLGSNKPAAIPAPVLKGPAFFKSELYRNFVKGEGLSGTLSDKEISVSLKGRSSDNPDMVGEIGKESGSGIAGAVGTNKKDKRGKKDRKEKEAKKDKKSKKHKAQKSDENAVDELSILAQEAPSTDKEERRALKEVRRARKEEKRRKRAQEQDG